MRLTKNMKNEIVNAMVACTTWEELKTAYVEWATKCDTETSQQFLNGAFEEVAKLVKDQHKTKDGKSYTKEPELSPEDFRTLMAELLNIDGITVEILGSWIWVSGNTKANKDALKQCGFRFSGKKQAWYKAPEGTKRMGRRYKSKYASYGELREAWDAQTVTEVEEIA